MRVNVSTVLTIMAMLINMGAALAEVSSVDELLEQQNPASALDNLGLDQREELVAKLVASLESADDARKLVIANALCKSSAWTSAYDDGEVQDQIWAQMVKVPDTQDPLMYALDCAAANREGYFRASTLTPLFNMRLSYCSGQPFGKDTMAELDLVQAQMEDFSKSIEDGLAKASKDAGVAKTIKSFFPMRTAFRLATLRAARAVQYANDQDWPSAQAEFRRTAEHLRKYAPQDYGSPWGAWRYRNDFEFYIDIYAWLGGEEELDLKKFAEWPAVGDDNVIKDSLSAGLLKQIAAQLEEQASHRHKTSPYVDWLYVERLLPGAATEAKECDNWRRRYYDTHALAEHIAGCTDGKPLENTVALRNFDACVHRFQAEDWSVQYMTIRRADEAKARVVIERFVEALLDRDPLSELKLTPEEMDEAIRVLNSAEPYSIEGRSDLVRMVSDQGLTTSMRNALEEVIDSNTVQLPWNTRPLFRRPTHF